MSEWIPVRERLPDAGAFVLIHFKDGTYEVARWLGGGWQSSDGLDFDYGRADEDVTHWTQLPLPPDSAAAERHTG